MELFTESVRASHVRRQLRVREFIKNETHQENREIMIFASKYEFDATHMYKCI